MTSANKMKYMLQDKELVKLMSLYKLGLRMEWRRVGLESLGAYLIVHFVLPRTPLLNIASPEFWTAIFVCLIFLLLYLLRKIQEDTSIEDIEKRVEELKRIENYFGDDVEKYYENKRKNEGEGPSIKFEDLL